MMLPIREDVDTNGKPIHEVTRSKLVHAFRVISWIVLVGAVKSQKLEGSAKDRDSYCLHKNPLTVFFGGV